MSRLRFDPRRPLFVSQQFQLSNKIWTVDSHFPWEDFWSYQGDEVHFYYNNFYLNHRPDLEGSMVDLVGARGDGLDAMTLEALHDLRNTINKQVRAKAANPREIQKKSCAFSRVRWKQIAKIRNWRAAYGHLEV